MTAAEKILQKALVASNIDSRQWNAIQAGLRDRAFFSSRVEWPNILDAARRLTAEHAAGGASLSEQRRDMRRYLRHEGYVPDANVAGTIKDLYSKARLDVIFKHNTATARGFVAWADGNTPGAYAAAPCQEFIRTHRRKVERTTWRQRWTEAGGQFYEGRMIAPKDSPVWTRLSVFGTPYPPFDWGSGMGVRDISRRESLRLGVITDDDIRKHVSELREKEDKGELPSMNGQLVSKITMRKDSDEFKSLEKQFNDEFGDQIQIANDEVFWTDNLVRDVHSGKRPKARLGMPSEELLNLMDGVIPKSDIDAYKAMSPSFSKSVFDQHAVKHEGKNENRSTNIPLSEGDFDLLPWVWRRPDKVIPVKKHHVVLELETIDGSYLQMSINTMHGFSSFYKTKKPLEATPGFAPFDPFRVRDVPGQRTK